MIRNLISPGVIPWMNAGLGNQMFVVSASYVIAKNHSCNLYLLQNPVNEHNDLKQNYLFSIFKYLGIHLSLNQTDDTFQILVSRKYKCEDRGRGAFIEWNPKNIIPPIILTSYYQYYPTLQPFEHEISELFLRGIDSVRSKMNVPQDSAFIHVRRGDYFKYPTVFPILGTSYYEEAIDKLNRIKTISKIFVLSDDMKWVKQQKVFINSKIEFYENKDIIECMALMSLCEAGAICANSTFSWWGAFLGAHRVRSPVFVPKIWIFLPVVSLFPDDWLIVG